jgi:hypothetical protein
MKWYQYPDVRVKVTFRWNAMDRDDYEAWQVEEATLLKLSEVGELCDGLAKYGYDLFSVAWLNLVKVRGANAPLVYTRGYLVRTGERSMSVRMREKKTVVRQMSDADRDRLAVVAAERAKTPPLEQWELVERDRMGVEWLKCHAAVEAYEVDFAEREELEAWRAYEWVVAQEEE